MPSLNLPRVVLIAMGHLCSILISRAVTILQLRPVSFLLSRTSHRESGPDNTALRCQLLQQLIQRELLYLP
jgi:hypothetical protein